MRWRSMYDSMTQFRSRWHWFAHPPGWIIVYYSDLTPQRPLFRREITPRKPGFPWKLLILSNSPRWMWKLPYTDHKPYSFVKFLQCTTCLPNHPNILSPKRLGPEQHPIQWKAGIWIYTSKDHHFFHAKMDSNLSFRLSFVYTFR